MPSRRKAGRSIPNNKITDDLKTNELFEKYYKQLNIVAPNEWDQFLTVFRSDLPSTFRITGFGQQSKQLLDLLKSDFLSNSLKTSLGVDIELKCLEWYPRSMAWQLDAPKTTIRKDPNLKLLHQFLISETETGSTSRQEAVSMIPPLLLDIKSHHTIIDLCAAPGSKAAQLIEMLHYDFEKNNKSDAEDSVPSGCVLANDLEVDRCYMMTHQLKRLKSPCIIVTKEDASVYPKLYINGNKSSSSLEVLEFDRVLADVPCSGDGTLRKNPQIWFSWSPGQGIGEHLLQLRILKRGLELLKEDGSGLLVYSTCSLNPVEDEAVVAAMLTSCEGTVELVEPPKWFGPDGIFKALPGICNWNVMLKDGTIVDNWENLPEKNKSSHKFSLFPPKNVNDLHLERCRRVLPHLNNTGGFFIAILRKNETLPWMKSKKNEESIKDSVININGASNDESVPNPPQKKISKMKFRAENPYKYIDALKDKEWLDLKDYFGMDDTRFNSELILYRPSENPSFKRHSFYFTNRRVKQIMELNAERGLSVINTGVCIFNLCDDKQYTGYRISQEGLETTFHWIQNKNRVFVLNHREHLKDLEKLMDEEIPLVSEMSLSIQKQWDNMTVGPVIIECLPVENADNLFWPKCPLFLAGWRGQKSLRHYLKLHERTHVMRLCRFREIGPPIKYLKFTEDGKETASKKIRVE